MSDRRNPPMPAEEMRRALRDARYQAVVFVDGIERIEKSLGEARLAAPIDWPARFRAAAKVARLRGRSFLGHDFARVARALASLPPDEVEAIGRALLGEAS